jgi:hypothetical protein
MSFYFEVSNLPIDEQIEKICDKIDEIQKAEENKGEMEK